MDNFTKQSLAIEVGQQLKGEDVVAALDQLRHKVGLPQRIRADNGSEFVSMMDRWAYDHGITMNFSRPGKSTDNPFIESFNGSFYATPKTEVCVQHSLRCGRSFRLAYLRILWRFIYTGQHVPSLGGIVHPNTRIFVAGHRGLVGGAIVRKLRNDGYDNLLLPGRSQLDLRNSNAVDEFFRVSQPELVFLAAAKVGGIQANATYPADFLIENLQIQNNVICAAHREGTRKLVFLGSSCIYPRLAPQPIKEEYLLAGPLEPTNEAYAIAKIAGVKLCQYFKKQYGFNAISLMPTNLYGPGDNFNLENSHVLPALIRKFHEAKVNGNDEVIIWGTGSPRREFLYVDDLADAVVQLARTYNGDEIVNVGVGQDISILELAELISRVVGFEGSIANDLSKPDGAPRKLLDVSRLAALGWRAKTDLPRGIEQTYRWYLDQQKELHH